MGHFNLNNKKNVVQSQSDFNQNLIWSSYFEWNCNQNPILLSDFESDRPIPFRRPNCLS